MLHPVQLLRRRHRNATESKQSLAKQSLALRRNDDAGQYYCSSELTFDLRP